MQAVVPAVADSDLLRASCWVRGRFPRPRTIPSAHQSIARSISLNCPVRQYTSQFGSRGNGTDPGGTRLFVLTGQPKVANDLRYPVDGGNQFPSDDFQTQKHRPARSGSTCGGSRELLTPKTKMGLRSGMGNAESVFVHPLSQPGFGANPMSLFVPLLEFNRHGGTSELFCRAFSTMKESGSSEKT